MQRVTTGKPCSSEVTRPICTPYPTLSLRLVLCVRPLVKKIHPLRKISLLETRYNTNQIKKRTLQEKSREALKRTTKNNVAFHLLSALY